MGRHEELKNAQRLPNCQNQLSCNNREKMEGSSPKGEQETQYLVGTKVSLHPVY